MSERVLDLVDRLRGIYTLAVNDGAGPLNGKDTYTESFPVPPIQKEAADEIERLRAIVAKAADAVSIMEKALRQLQADNPDSLASWPNDDGSTTYRTVEDWVDYVLDKARGGVKS